MTIRESAASGDRVAALRDLRDLLAKQIEVCESGRDLASLSGRFQAVIAEIAELDGATEEKGDVIDEIAKRRNARRTSAAKGPVRASK